MTGRDAAIAAIATRQHGLITSRQLTSAGLSRQAISDRVKAGRLHRVRRGVYAVGHKVLSPTAYRLAAVLTVGDSALAGHTTAAAIWDIRQSTTSTHHITVPDARRDRAGIRVHHRPIHADDRALRDGVPVTSLARTLVDLGDVVPAIQVRNAFVRAEQLRLIDMRAIDAALARSSDRRRGPRILRELLRGYDPRWELTRSRLELAMLDLLAGENVPEPEVNAWIHDRFMADFLWRQPRLIVETDGAQTHDTATARRADARRDRSLTSLGYRVLWVRSSDLSSQPEAVAERVEQELRATARPARAG